MNPLDKKQVDPIKLKDLREGLGEHVDRVKHKEERYYISKHGKLAAAIVPVWQAKFLEEMENEIDLRLAREAMNQGSKPWDIVRKSLEERKTTS